DDFREKSQCITRSSERFLTSFRKRRVNRFPTAYSDSLHRKTWLVVISAQSDEFSPTARSQRYEVRKHDSCMTPEQIFESCFDSPMRGRPRVMVRLLSRK